MILGWGKGFALKPIVKIRLTMLSFQRAIRVIKHTLKETHNKPFPHQ